jgi:hypothetical protein
MTLWDHHRLGETIRARTVDAVVRAWKACRYGFRSPDRVFIARDGVPELTTVELTDGEVRDLVEQMLQSAGRRVDLSSPFVDASLPDGSRLHVVIPDVAQRHWAVNIREFTQEAAAKPRKPARRTRKPAGALSGSRCSEIWRKPVSDSRRPRPPGTSKEPFRG